MKKKSLVILAGIVHPEASPPGRLALEYAKILKEHYDTRIVFIQSSVHPTHGEVINGIRFFSVFGLRVYLESFVKRRKDNTRSPFFSKLLGSLIIVLKSFGRLQSMFLFPNNLRWHYKGAYKKLIKLDKEQPVDIVFSICSPFSAHLAARDFKKMINPEVRWVTYTVDPFTAGEKLLDYAVFKRHKHELNSRAEKEVYALADYSFVSEEIFSTDQAFFKQTLFKTRVLPYFIKKPELLDVEIYDKAMTNAVFAGRFYKDIRNPSFFLETFSHISIPRFQVNLFTASNCEQILDTYVHDFPHIFKRRSLVSPKVIDTVLGSADLLINVGNSLTDFKPSKVFEYISTGRPIINFYRNGLRDDVLDRHPFCLQIDEDSLSPKEAAQRITEFWSLHAKSRMSWEIIEEIYSDFSHQNLRNVLFSVFNFELFLNEVEKN